MKTKVRLCKLLFSTRLLVSLLIILGILECLHWHQGVGEGFPGSKDLILADYPELSSMKSSSNFHSSSHLPEKPASPSSSPIQTESNPRKKSPPVRQNILLLAYARSGKHIFHTLHIKGYFQWLKKTRKTFHKIPKKSRLLLHWGAPVGWYPGGLLLWTSLQVAIIRLILVRRGWYQTTIF